MKVYLIDTTSLSIEDRRMFYDYAEKMSFIAEYDLSQNGKFLIRVFLDSESDVSSLLNIPTGCTCTDITGLV